MPITLSIDEARRLLLRATLLERPAFSPGLDGALEVLEALGCIQLDPIDRIGTSPDLVVHARVDGTRRGDWARASMPRHGFEHFAKERCVLPARMFPLYRDQAAQTPWWRLGERLKRLDPAIIQAVLDEIRQHGPLSAAALSDHGSVQPMDWSGWKGTGKAGTMALEVLWTRCEVVTAGRSPSGQRLYDLPERALPDHHALPGTDFARSALLERVRSAGLLSTASGPWWSMLSEERNGPVPAALVAEGRLVEVLVDGSRRSYLALPEQLEAMAAPLNPDDRMRVLGPLDPLLWDRKLVEQVFSFAYVWEVYKPEGQRRWGWYVCPLLHQGRLVGRIEARRGESGIDLERVWGEKDEMPDPAALDAALDRLAAMQ